MDVFVETERLVLRRFTVHDVDNLYELDGDPDVMRFIAKERTPRHVIEAEILPRYLGYYERCPHGGVWAVVESSTTAFAGWFALRPLDDGSTDVVELGYRLRRSLWGKGYATEGARALVEKAFTELGIERVFAETMAVNRASRRVMAKAGLTYVRTFHLPFDDPIDGTELGEVEYALTRADWERARRPLDRGRVG